MPIIGGASKARHIDARVHTIDIIGDFDVDCTLTDGRPQRVPPLNVLGGAFISESLLVGKQICMQTGGLISGSFDGNLIGDTFVFGNLSVEGITLIDDDLVVVGNIETNVVEANIVCPQILRTNTIEPKTGGSVTISGTLITDDIFANDITANSISISGNNITANVDFTTINSNSITTNFLTVTDTLTGNIIIGDELCITSQIAANFIVPKTGDTVTINGKLVADEIDAGSILINGNSITVGNVDIDNIVSQTIISNTIQANSITTQILTVTDTLTGNIIIGDELCITSQIAANLIVPKTGDTVTIGGKLVADQIDAGSILINGNSITVSNVDIENIVSQTIVSNTIQANIMTTIDLCATGRIETDLLGAKGSTLIIENDVDLYCKTLGNVMTINTDTINEKTANAGVTIEGILIRDGNIFANITGNSTVDELLVSGNACISGTLLINNIEAKTGNTVTATPNFVSGIIQATAGFDYKRTVVNVAAYMITPTDDILAVRYTTTGSPTLTLPAISTLPNNRKRYIIVDEGGNASINPITIMTSGGNLIVGGSSVNIDGDYNTMVIYSDETSEWFIT